MPDELGALEAEAIADQAPPPGAAAPGASEQGGAAPGAAIPRTETREEWIGSVQFVAKIVTTAYPQLAPVWTETRLEELGGALHGVAAKYGWSIGGWLTRWQAEIALAMVAGPLLRDSARAMKAAPGGSENITSRREPAAQPGDPEPAQQTVDTIRPNTGEP